MAEMFAQTERDGGAMTSNNGTTKSSLLLEEEHLKVNISVGNENIANLNNQGEIHNQDEMMVSSFSNRGNKLLYNSDWVDYTRLNSYRDDLRVVKVDEVDGDNGEKRPRLIIRSKEQTVEKMIEKELNEEFGEVSNNENYESEENDRAQSFLDSIDIASILSPIQQPTDIVRRKELRDIYQSGHLERLANETIELIEKEQDSVNQLSKLMSVFLGDDPEKLLADALMLPKYDHNLDLGRQIAADGEALGAVGVEVSAASNRDQDATQEEEELANEVGETGENGAIGASETNENARINQFIGDAFFKLPEFKRDFNFGISKVEDAEESRQLIQIALQRNEEFIRSLTSIRNGFIRANRLKNNIHKWCKEMDEEEDMEVDNQIDDYDQRSES